MRLPQKKKPGDPVLAADWNLLLEAIAARTPRSGAGLELMSSSGGFAYCTPSPKGTIPKGLPPFSVIGIAKNSGTNHLVTIKDGWVIERVTEYGVTSVRFHMPEHGATPLNDTPRPQLEMNIGESAWCKIESENGALVGTPKIVVSENPPADTGTISHVRLIKLEEDGNSKPTVLTYQQSDIELSPVAAGLTGWVRILQVEMDWYADINDPTQSRYVAGDRRVLYVRHINGCQTEVHDGWENDAAWGPPDGGGGRVNWGAHLYDIRSGVIVDMFLNQTPTVSYLYG